MLSLYTPHKGLSLHEDGAFIASPPLNTVTLWISFQHEYGKGHGVPAEAMM